ncbi:MAG: CAP domain-containing protein [Candidatus Bathyarchaeia archaeon]
MPLKRKKTSSFAFIAVVLVASLLSLRAVTPTVTGLVRYDSGNPTPDEQLVLEYVNRARANPIAEGQRLGIDIHEGLQDPSLVGPRPPLAMNKLLLSIAEAHSKDMYNGNYFSHTDPNGTTAFNRITNVGYDYVRAGENMAASTGSTAAELEDFMMVDSGTSGRLHRVNLLDLFNAYPCGTLPCVYYEVGVGYYAGATSNSIDSDFITEDFGAAPSAGPFLLGVVYKDVNHNNFYDIGEGTGGVSITPSSGGYYAVSSSSGGYAIPIGTSGTITVTASGPGFGPITKTVALTGVNIKLDFTTSAQVSSSSTSLQTSTPLQTSTTSSVTATSSTQTASSSTTAASSPFIALNPTSAPAGSTVNVTGSGFSMSDTGCLISGSSVSASSCVISGGNVKGSFVVGNVGVGSYSVAAIGGPAGDSATANFQLILLIPSMTINPNSAEVGAKVTVSGSGFSPSDSTCTITGSGGWISSPSCSISAGAVTGSFVVANVTAAVYAITVTGNQTADSISADFTVDAPSTQTTSSTSSRTTMTSQSSTTTVAQPTVMVVTSVVTTVVSPPTTTALRTSSSISVTVPLALPPVPGFPFESIITGIILGLTFLAIVRQRRKEP